MSAPEIAHRVGERVRKWVDKKRSYRFNAAVPVAGLIDIRALSLPPRVLAELEERARAFDEGRFGALGVNWPISDEPPSWHLDPVTGRQWPRDVFCFDIPYRSEASLGDVKYVWEINRLQHLVPVAIHASITGNRVLARLCVRHVLSWIESNPPFMGVNWSSGIELALRAYSMLAVVGLAESGVLTDAERNTIGASLSAHLFWLRRYPSRFSSANNHAVAEAAGIAVLALHLPGESEAAEAWNDAAETLNAEILKQILPDGVPAEQSPTYGAFTIELALASEAVARGLGRTVLRADTLDRMTQFGQFIAAIAGEEGRVPSLGDDDEGRVVAGEADASCYVRSISRLVGNRPEGLPSGETLREAILASAAIARNVPRGGAARNTFESGGYTVLRTGEPGGGRLLFDHGPLGYLSIAAHGHADALAILLSVGNSDVLVDAGTYLYHSGGSWRRYFRGTRAHNTLLISGRDQSVQAGHFNWATKANVHLLGDPSPGAVGAEHDGYLREFGVRHRRTVGVRNADSYVIDDELIGGLKPGAIVEIGFLVAPGLGVRETLSGWRIYEGAETLVSIDCPEASRRIDRGIEHPVPAGWVSSAFGQKQPVSRLVAVLPAGETRLVTTIWVRPGDQ
jgi:hypothetical protein